MNGSTETPFFRDNFTILFFMYYILLFILLFQVIHQLKRHIYKTKNRKAICTSTHAFKIPYTHVIRAPPKIDSYFLEKSARITVLRYSVVCF